MPHNKKCKSTLIPDAPKQGKTGQKIQQTFAHEAHHSETHVKLGAAVNYRPPIEVAASISIATQPLRVRAVCNGDFLVVLSTTGVFTKHPL